MFDINFVINIWFYVLPSVLNVDTKKIPYFINSTNFTILYIKIKFCPAGRIFLQRSKHKFLADEIKNGQELSILEKKLIIRGNKILFSYSLWFETQFFYYYTSYTIYWTRKNITQILYFLKCIISQSLLNRISFNFELSFVLIFIFVNLFNH